MTNTIHTENMIKTNITFNRAMEIRRELYSRLTRGGNGAYYGQDIEGGFEMLNTKQRVVFRYSPEMTEYDPKVIKP